MLKCGGMVLLVLTSVARAQLVNTPNSEAQLASILCRNPKEEPTNELLLNKNAQLVNATLWNALLDCASSAQRQGSLANLIEVYKLTLRVADRLNKPELEAATYYHLGRTYSLMSDFGSSIQAYEKSRTLFEQAGIESNLIYVLADLGALYLTAGDYENARSYSEQSLAIAGQVKLSRTKDSLGPIEYGQARSLHTLGEIDLRHGSHEEALKKLCEALALYEPLEPAVFSPSIQMAEVLVALAKVYGWTGKYGKAFSHLTKAHQVSRSSGDQNTRANIMSSQAALFFEQEDYAAAQKHFNASLAIYKTIGKATEEARVLLNLGVIEERQGNYDDALHLFQRSMDYAQTLNLIDVQIAAGLGLGAVLTSKRDFPNALNALNQGLEIARLANAKTREVELLWRTAQTYYAMQNYRESAALAEQALALARSLKLPKLTYLTTVALGEAYAVDAKVELAITTLKEAINQIEEMRDQTAGRLEGRHLFFENKVGPYHTLVKLLTKQGKSFEALLYAERAKARVLLEAVRNNRSDLADVYTPAEKVEAERLINKLSAIRERIQSETDREVKSKLQTSLNEVQGELVLFQERLAAAHPELLLRAGPARPLTRASLKTLVTANDLAYLEYVVTGDTVGLFTLKRNGLTTDHDLKYISLPVNADELRRKVEEFHSALAERHPDYEGLGRELHRILIEPATNELQSIKAVCIIPDGFLWTLPFQAVTTARGNHLIQEYSLFYAPSLSVLNEVALRRPQQSSESLIAFGNPLIAKSEELKLNLRSLPEAEVEVDSVAAAVRAKTKRVLIGVQADEKTFKELVPGYATIHLATHGVLDNRVPLNSYLLLTKPDDDQNDGLLQAREIIDLRLNADLAVLSACETGNGRISPGEGVIGMSWAFFVAGARSVVVSQWRVNSASTAHLMKNFYTALAKQSKAEALRAASLRSLKDPRYRHPFYWAGFVLVGSN